MKAINARAALATFVQNRFTALGMDARLEGTSPEPLATNKSAPHRPALSRPALDQSPPDRSAPERFPPRDLTAPDRAFPDHTVPGAGFRPAPQPGWMVSLATASGALALGLGASFAPPPIPLALLALLASSGLFFLLAAATGRVRLVQRSEAATETIADAWPDGILITTRLGGAVYANAALGRLVSQSDPQGLAALELWLAGEPSASEALFRLVRAGERGEARTEEIDLPFTPRTSGSARTSSPRRAYRISVAPLDIASAPYGSLVLWRLCDITREHDARRLAARATELRLEAYDAAPAGLLVIDADHSVVHMNATIEQWLGLTALSDRDEHASLEAVFSAHGAEILRRHFERHATAPFQCPLELAVRAGRRLPVRVVASPPQASTAHLQGCRVLTIVRAEWADPIAISGETADRTFSRHYQAAPFGIATITSSGMITSSNGAFASMALDGAGGIQESALDVLARDASPEARAEVARCLAEVLAGQAGLPPVDFAADKGGTRARRLYAVPLAPQSGSREAAILYVVDTTEQRELEAKFAQSQKMEAIGKLAGEMAHNFNNVLTAIIGSADLMLQTFRASDPAHRDIQNIRQSAFRAAELVNQLMSFSRQQTLRLELGHLGEWVAELKPTVKAALGEKIDLKIQADRDLWYVKADRTQIQQVLMNFASNSRDAMPAGGSFKLSVRNVTERDVLRLTQGNLPVAEYVLIEASDDGAGMPPDVKARIFDPFYTTKDVGKGTGLGLASVYGIVKQLSGFIYADSTVGAGTTFRLYLPRAHPELESERTEPRAAKKDVKPVDLTGSATLLIVDDDDMVRSVAVRQLLRFGYRVLQAANGVEALDVIATENGNVDLVISDVVMPEMDGPAFLKAVRPQYPDLRIIFVSGHTNEAFRETIGGDEAFAFLQKPYSLPKLAERVKEELAK